MSNYPPGVSGNEYEIAGPDTEIEGRMVCPDCVDAEICEDDQETDVMIYTYHGERWAVCSAKGHDIELPDFDSYDWEE